MIKEIYNYLFHKSVLLLNRNQLCSIDLGIKDNLTENEIRERDASIASSFKHTERIIKKLIKAQQEFMANQCENEQQLLFARGTMNGLTLVQEELNSCKQQHKGDNEPEEKFNKHKVI